MEARFETVVGGNTYGCDQTGRGLFLWSDRDGWKQQAGTLDTPRFANQAQFRRYVAKRQADSEGE